MAEGIQKICTSCGVDVAGRRRTKDEAGRYWCADCYVRAARRRSAGARRTTSPPPGAAAGAPSAAFDLEPVSADGPALHDGAVAPVGAGQCPSCTALFDAASTICTTCGYDRRTRSCLDTSVRNRTAGVVAGEVAVAGAIGTSVVVTSVVGALVGGLVGAIIWGAIVRTFSVEISWIAIGVGALTGLGAVLGARGRAGVLTGVLAAIIALAAIAGGRGYAIHAELDQLIAHEIDDELAIETIAAVLQEEAGESVFGMWFRHRGFASVQPRMSWREAMSKARGIWRGEMSAEDRAAALEVLQEEISFVAEDRMGTVQYALKESLHPIDALFALVAIVTAFSVGSGRAHAEAAEKKERAAALRGGRGAAERP